MKEELLMEVRQLLKDSADEKTRESANRFFKEGEKAQVYGIKAPEVNKIGKHFYQQIKALPKQEIFELCEALLKSNYLEEAVVAFKCSEALHKQYEPSDFNVFEHWVKNYISNWAACDTLCNHTAGNFIMMYPEFLEELKKWVRSSNRWVRRASAVTLIIPARKGLFLNDVFEIADRLLLDQDDMVQKGYGWMLKAASEAYQKEVFDYVVSKSAVMPRTALRYAIEKMPPQLKSEAMKK